MVKYGPAAMMACISVVLLLSAFIAFLMIPDNGYVASSLLLGLNHGAIYFLFMKDRASVVESSGMAAIVGFSVLTFVIFSAFFCGLFYFLKSI